MLVVTPDKYKIRYDENNNPLPLKDPDIRRSYQQIVNMILDFKQENPSATKLELEIYTNGILKGRKRR